MIRMLTEKDEVRIYVGEISAEICFTPVFPLERQKEIEGCKNERVRKEKYCAWKLLEYALKDTFDISMTEMRFAKLSSGKWTAEDFCFSLSHTKGVVAVVLSKRPVGVDVEKGNSKLLRLQDKILSENEREEYSYIEEKERYLLEKWTQKESIFKAYKESGFVPREIDTQGYLTRTWYLEKGGVCLSVAGEGVENARLCLAVEYL